MNTEIRNKQFLHAMERAGLQRIHLQKGEGYFYIWSDDEEEIESLVDDSIMQWSFGQQSVSKWVKDIQELLNNKK